MPGFVHELVLEGPDGPVTYEVETFPGRVGYKLLLRLMKTVGEPVGEILESFFGEMRDGKKAGTDDVYLQGDRLGGAFTKLATALIDAGEDAFLDALFKLTKRNGKTYGLASSDERWSFDVAFRQNYVEMFAILGYLLKVNFLNFSDGSLVNRMRDLIASHPAAS